MGSSGMSFDVSLRNINMAMPHTVEDMYAYGDQSMYLIKVIFVIIFVSL